MSNYPYNPYQDFIDTRVRAWAPAVVADADGNFSLSGGAFKAVARQTSTGVLLIDLKHGDEESFRPLDVPEILRIPDQDGHRKSPEEILAIVCAMNCAPVTYE